MAEKDENARPIIIKKIKKGGHGHHGGAWKVAYADFVTAMMAFFLLLWLLSSSSKATLDGIAEYFTPTIGLADKSGFETGGQSASPDGTRKSDNSPVAVVIGQSPTGETKENPTKTTMVQKDADGQLFEKAEEAIKKAFESDPTLRELADNVIVEQTPEGLKIELTDSDKHPMFVPGNKEITADGQKLLNAMKLVIEKMPNYISITGHTDAAPLDRGNGDYTNWELSADRANAARRYLLSQGLEAERPRKIVGMGDSDLLDPDDPRNPRNRRISIILLKGSHMSLPDSFFSAPRDLLSAPDAPLPEQAEPAAAGDKKVDTLE
jgi:chemotaxis protein MotB